LGTYNGSPSLTTAASGIETNLTAKKIREAIERIKKSNDIVIQKPRAYGHTALMKQVEKYYNMMHDWQMYNFKPQLIVDEKYFNGNWSIGIDLGREDKMCTEGSYDYEKENLRDKVKMYEQNHLGATTERFIEMARELGRSEHLRQELHEAKHLIADLDVSARRANEQAGYSDAQTDKANKRAQSWESAYYTLERRHENYKKAHAPKRAVKKTTQKRK